jgi:pyrrolidone-carboxylate peptidase
VHRLVETPARAATANALFDDDLPDTVSSASGSHCCNVTFRMVVLIELFVVA